MEPSVYIDNEFFQVLDKFKEKFAFSEFSENKELINYEKLKKTLFKSKIICDINDRELIRLLKKSGSATFVAENWFEALISKAQKEEKLQRKELDLNSTRSIYLLNKNKTEVANLIESYNIICEGIDYDFSTNICYDTLASILVDKQMNGSERLQHRTKNVILVDPHIFKDGSATLQPKIPNLVKFLKLLFLDNTNSKCNLSIITNNENNNAKFQSRINEITELLGNPNLIISVFAHEDKLFEQNRHLITDYCFMDLQHVFDRDNGSISANFIFDNNIRENYFRLKHFLDKLLLEYQRYPEKMGLQINKFGNILSNGILKL